MNFFFVGGQIKYKETKQKFQTCFMIIYICKKKYMIQIFLEFNMIKKYIKTSGVKCFIISLKITNFKEILGKCNKNSENRILWLLGTQDTKIYGSNMSI